MLRGVPDPRSRSFNLLVSPSSSPSPSYTSVQQITAFQNVKLSPGAKAVMLK